MTDLNQPGVCLVALRFVRVEELWRLYDASVEGGEGEAVGLFAGDEAVGDSPGVEVEDGGNGGVGVGDTSVLDVVGVALRLRAQRQRGSFRIVFFPNELNDLWKLLLVVFRKGQESGFGVSDEAPFLGRGAVFQKEQHIGGDPRTLMEVAVAEE